MSEGSFHRRGSALAIAGWCFSFDGLVDVPSGHYRTEREAQVPDEQEQRDAHRPSFNAFVVDVNVQSTTVRVPCEMCR